MYCWISEHPRIPVHPHLSLQRPFFPGVALPSVSLLPFIIGQGSFGLGSPVSSTMTTLRLLIALPGRLFPYLPVLVRFVPVLYRFASLPSEQR